MGYTRLVMDHKRTDGACLSFEQKEIVYKSFLSQLVQSGQLHNVSEAAVLASSHNSGLLLLVLLS